MQMESVVGELMQHRDEFVPSNEWLRDIRRVEIPIPAPAANVAAIASLTSITKLDAGVNSTSLPPTSNGHAASWPVD
jgi:hypothetical protein